MPLRLVPPRKGRSQNYRIRGAYCGVRVDESTRSHRKPAAEAYLKRRERQIEGGLVRKGGGKTFAVAVVDYVAVCPHGEVSRAERALDHFTTTPIEDIDTGAVKEYAKAAYPPGPSEGRAARNATVNREIVNPVAAILHAAGLERRFRRYPEPAGRIRTDAPEAIEAFLDALPHTVASRSRKRTQRGRLRYPRAYALFIFMCNTRRTETMRLEWDGTEPTPRLDLDQRQATFWLTKNDEPRIIPLNRRLLDELVGLPHRTGRVFGYANESMINADWREARGEVSKDYPELATLTPHGARHVFATWRRRAGDDLKKLMEVGGWLDVKSVLRYAHVPTEEIRQAFEESPLNRGKSVESGRRKKSSG